MINIEIRPVTAAAECRHIEQIEQAAWQGPDLDVVPDHLMIAIARSQGVVLLAWHNDRPVGFNFGFPSYVEINGERQLKIYSHQTGVLPEYQSQGIGERLKWAQRDVVLSKDIKLISWTFDPLETKNGRLNIHKLGAVCNSYYRNYYGSVRDQLNANIETDRFQVDWWIDSQHVAHKAARSAQKTTIQEWLAAGTMFANHPSVDSSTGLLQPNPESLPDFNQLTDRICIVVPADFQEIKSKRLEIAQQWRYHSRHLFEQAFTAGYTVIDLLQDTHASGQPFGAYILQKEWSHENEN